MTATARRTHVVFTAKKTPGNLASVSFYAPHYLITSAGEDVLTVVGGENILLTSYATVQTPVLNARRPRVVFTAKEAPLD